MKSQGTKSQGIMEYGWRLENYKEKMGKNNVPLQTTIGIFGKSNGSTN
jgi:hypothetical protein